MKSLAGKFQPHPELQVTKSGKTIVLQWDNRRISKCLFTTIFLAMFWLLWVPMTLFVTVLLVTQSEASLFWGLWLIFGYAGVLLLPIMWSQRYAIERIEIGNKHFHHSYHNWPAWMHTNWNVSDVARIEFGNYDEESITTISVRTKWNRDMIAYWTQPAFRAELFEMIRDHLQAIDSTITVVNLNEEDTRKT